MLKIDVTKKYALAVSGGVDSMVMLHAFAHHLPRPDFYVVTVNHNIRTEGKADCQFVQKYCKKLGSILRQILSSIHKIQSIFAARIFSTANSAISLKSVP